MNRQPWTGTTRAGASHEPQVKRRQKTAKEVADAADEQYQEWRRQMVSELWGRP